MREKSKNFLWGTLIFLFVGGCTYGVISNDIDIADRKKRTSYFYIYDKDYVDLSSTMFDNSYKYVVYAIRYDKDMKIISMHTKRNQRIIVTKYNYDRLKVDKLYSKKEAKLK